MPEYNISSIIPVGNGYIFTLWTLNFIKLMSFSTIHFMRNLSEKKVLYIKKKN